MLLALVDALLVGGGSALQGIAIHGIKLQTRIIRLESLSGGATYAIERIVLFPPIVVAICALKKQAGEKSALEKYIVEQTLPLLSGVGRTRRR